MGYLSNAGLSYFFGKLKTIFAPISHGHGGATQSAAGFMSAADKKKLDGIAEGANKYSLPTATSNVLGGVKTGANITNNSGVLSVTAANVTNALGYIPPKQDTNTWRPVVNSLTNSATDQSLAANQGKILNESKAAMIVLTNENLNDVVTPGFYSSGGSNSVTNKPSNVDHFGLIVIHRASGNYYTQIIYGDSAAYRRQCANGTWSGWVQDKLTDTDTWRPVVNSLTNSATDQSLAANQGKILNESKAAMIVLTNENLNDVVTPGFYSSGGSNSVTNKPSNVDHFGLIVIHRASGNYYTQIIYGDSAAYRRQCANGTWSGWVQDKLTDTDTWRGIQNNLTSDSTTDSLSAAQGKALKTLVDGKAAMGHTHTWDSVTGKPSTFTPSSHTHGVIKNLSVSGTTITYTKDDNTTGTITTQDTNTTYDTFKGATTSEAGSTGLVIAPVAGNAKRYLRSDGTWAVPPDTNTTYGVFAKATADVAGSTGLVPAPAKGQQTYYLRGDGTWAVPANTWRGIQDNLTSTSTTDSLSANQGKVLKGLIDGKAASGHTHNYAGSSSAGGAATSANKVNAALTINLNGTSQGAWDGSSAKSISITAASVGATSVTISRW